MRSLDEFFANNNEYPSYRLQQVNRAIYVDLVTEFADITTLPLELRQRLKSQVEIDTLGFVAKQVSSDRDTVKVVFERKTDGQKLETVLMKHRDGRNTVCVSCMVGCPVNCSFCATGKMGFGGNLSADEMVEQVLYFARDLRLENRGSRGLRVEDRKGGSEQMSKGTEIGNDGLRDSTPQQTVNGERVTNIVFMGMGEPMLNLPNVKEAIRIFTEEMGVSKRKITVSTSGYLPQLRDLIEWGFRGRIAVSLHAPNQELREKLMPVAKLYPIDKLFKTLFEFEKITNKRITYEYIMIDGVTDTEGCARQLGLILQGHLAHVNLIPYNSVTGEAFKRSSKRNIKKFKQILDQYRVENTVRVTMGDDIDAACGQLVDRLNKKHAGIKVK